MDEQVFHATLKRIRWSTDRDDLAKATGATLQLLLRRPGDRVLLKTLLAQVASITRHIPGDQAPANAIRQTAMRCVLLLQTAKQGRLTRAQDHQASQRRHHRFMLLMASLLAAALLYAVI